MENIVCIIILFLTILMYKLIFRINIKKAKELEENKELEKITSRFPSNVEIAEEMLDMLNNKDVKIEEAKDTKTSLYIVVSNKILIADMKDNYARIQTIAHECIHSCQDKRLLLFNFIFSNISMLYFILITIFAITGLVPFSMMQVFILTLLSFIQFSVRGFLETDAMTKSKYLAKDYIEKKGLITKDEEDVLIKEYENINKIGVPFTLDNLITSLLFKIAVYIITSFF